MNPNQQPPNSQAAKTSSQNSRSRPLYNMQPIPYQNSNQNPNPSSITSNQQGKISLRNNNTKKLYKVNTEGGQDNETFVLNSSKESEGKVGDISVRTVNLENRIRQEKSFVKNGRNQDDRSVLGRQEGNSMIANSSIYNRNMNNNHNSSINNHNTSLINNPTTKSNLSSKVPSSISSIANNSSILTSHQQKFRTPSSSANTKQQGLSTITYHQSTNSPSIISTQNHHYFNNGINQVKYFQNESTKSINLTGQESVEQSGGKGSSSSSFYDRGNKVMQGDGNNSKGEGNNNKSGCFRHVGYNNSRKQSVLPQQYQNQSGYASTDPTSNTINYTKPFIAQNTSIIKSIQHQYQQSLSSYHHHPSTQLNNKMTNSTSHNSNQNSTSINNAFNNNNSTFNSLNSHSSTPYYLSHNHAPEQAPSRKSPSYYINRPLYQKQPIQRQPSINKSTQHVVHHHIIGNTDASVSANMMSRPIPQVVSFLPSDQQQLNARSSLTVRHLEYGRALQLEERAKSHNKNHSTTDLMQNTDNYSQYSYLTAQINNQSTPATFQTHQQAFISQSQSFNSQEQSVQLAKNPYLPLLNKSTENKTYVLDSIQQKDEFSKFFVRNSGSSNNSPSNNSRHDQKSQSSSQNIKHIQRQKPQTKFNQKQNKIHYVAQNSMARSYDHNYSSNQFQNDQSNTNSSKNYSTVPNFINLKYIKSPTNNTQEKLQMIDKGSKNYEKYLKVSYEPSLVIGNDKIHHLIGKQRQKSTQISHQDHKHQSLSSMNSSFKQASKSQTSSLINYPKPLHKQKPSSFIQYSNNQQPLLKNKHNKNYPVQIYSSNKNFHQLFNHEENHMVREEDVFRKTIDSGVRVPNFGAYRYRRENDKGLQSLGAYETRPQFIYETQQRENNSHVIRVNQPGMRFKSPDFNINDPPHPLSKPTYPNLQITSPQYSPNKQTVFSPTQKSLQPAQKSYFLAQSQSQQNRQNVRQKKSIKKMLVSQSKGIHQKPQVFYNYNFKDLLKGEHNQSRPNSQSILQAITKNQLTRIFCSTFKIGQNQNGCDCIPKCYWVDMWLDKMHKHPLTSRQSLIKNLDKNSVGLSFSMENNVWKNLNNDEAISFADGNNFTTNSKLSRDQVETFKQIEKDIPRTCSDHPTFKTQRYRDFLRQLLIHFYYLDPHLGYVQGMNIIAASITYHSRTVLETLQIMDLVMNVLNYKKIYLNDMQKCKQLTAKTSQLIRHYCYDMYNFVTVQNQVDLEMFILGWYFSMLGTFVPLEAMHFVINRFVDQQFQGIAKIIVTYFIFIKDILMEKTDPNQIMQELSVQSMIERSKKIDWNELISVSDKLQITLEKDKLQQGK